MPKTQSLVSLRCSSVAIGITILAALCGFSSPITQVGKEYEVRTCDGRAGTCRENECRCTKWIIEWRTPGGVVWGTSEAKTRELVVAARDRDIAFEKSYARFFQVPFDQKFANPSEPICDTCNPQLANPTESSRATINNASQLYNEWTRKTFETVPAFVKAVFTPDTTINDSPYHSFGSVLRDYANALRDVRSKLKTLRQSLSFTYRQQGRLMGNLELATRELKTSSSFVDSTYNKLPQNIRDAIVSGGVTNVSTNTLGAWARSLPRANELFSLSNDGRYLVERNQYTDVTRKFLISDLVIVTVHPPGTGYGDDYNVELTSKAGGEYIVIEVASKADADAAVSELIARGVGRN